jgi:hypothetical protein
MEHVVEPIAKVSLLRKHSEWIDEQVLERWRGAGSPEPAAHGAASSGGGP